MALAIPSNSGLVISSGWKPGAPFTARGGIVTVAAAAGVLAVAPQSVVSRVVAPGSRAYLQYMAVRVVDMAGYDQLYFALRINGALIAPWEKISGEQFVDDHLVAIDQEFEGGLIELIASNISGTAEAGASVNAGDLRVLGRVVGFNLTQAG